jgi:hypothetical protein
MPVRNEYGWRRKFNCSSGIYPHVDSKLSISFSLGEMIETKRVLKDYSK